MYFPAFGLNTEILHSKSPCSVQMGEYTDQKTPNTDIFLAVGEKGKTRTNGK